MKKKGFATVVLLTCCIAALQAGERFMLNSDVMDYMPRRSYWRRQYSPIEIFSLDMIRTIQFDSTAILLDGSFGWASTLPNGFGARSMTIGKIYIRGLYIPQGNTWEGRVYPTNHIVIIRNRTYPVFLLHPEKQKKQ